MGTSDPMKIDGAVSSLRQIESKCKCAVVFPLEALNHGGVIFYALEDDLPPAFKFIFIEGEDLHFGS